MASMKLMGVLAAPVLAAAFTLAGAAPAAAAGGYTCSGGSIAARTYSALKVTGFCAVDSGNVTVLKNVIVTSTGGLVAPLAHSTLTVDGNVTVQRGGSLDVGCDPNDPCPDGSSATSSDSILGNLDATGAPFLILHDDAIGGNVSDTGGGVAYACGTLFPFNDFAYDSIHGNVSITGLRTCWDGFAHSTVGGNVAFNNNQTELSDGNLVDDNTIARNLSCHGNAPVPHLGQSAPAPNSVAGHTDGQCVGEVGEV